jgi:1-phosphofructokinase
MILTVTLNPAVDHTLRLHEPLHAGTVQRTDDTRFDAGGKGINVSKYLDGLGTETVATGILGGFLGSVITEQLTAEGVPHDFIEVNELTRLNTTVLTDAEYKINHTGPTVDATVVDSIVRRIRHHEPEIVVVAGSLPPGLDVEAIDRIARAGDWTPVVDVGGEKLQRLTETYALCKPNREELAAATGESTDTVEDCLAAAETLRASGFDHVIASLGADGAVLKTSSESIRLQANDVDVVDTVGAGDALLSGVLAALSSGTTNEEALRIGVDVASRVTAVSGTTVPALPGIGPDTNNVGDAMR